MEVSSVNANPAVAAANAANNMPGSIPAAWNIVFGAAPTPPARGKPCRVRGRLTIRPCFYPILRKAQFACRDV